MFSRALGLVSTTSVQKSITLSSTSIAAHDPLCGGGQPLKLSVEESGVAMKKALIAAGLGLAPFCFGAAFAQQVLLAQLGGISGNVLVDQGSGFAPASDGAQLKPGNRIMVSGKGSAILTFGPDCTMVLPADSMTTFTGTESCTVGTQDGTTPPTGTGTGLAVVLVGGLVVGGGALFVTSVLGDDDDDDLPPQS